jgi:uncharacterized protein
MRAKMETYIPRYFHKLEESFFIFGPRGTGKSTFLRHEFPDALWIDLLRPDVFRKYSSHPELIFELVEGNPEKKTIIVDEVQKVPEILPAIHSLVEEKKGRQFILTGSSARKLKKAGTDLLAGRLLLKHFFPFISSEVKGKWNFDSALQYGTLPIVFASKNPQHVLDTYVSLYIQEEVYQESLVRNIGNFSRFLEAASFSHSSQINISNVARECQVERKVVEAYIKILEDILIATRLAIFTKKAKRALTSHPKFYFFDTGVFRTIRPKGPLDKPEEIEGTALEGLVLQQLKAWVTFRKQSLQLFFWRSRKGTEVDFILYGQEGIFAIEVKNSTRVRPEDLRGLKEFYKDYPTSERFLLYRGKERLLKDGILCIPCEDFLLQLSPDFSLVNVKENRLRK